MMSGVSSGEPAAGSVTRANAATAAAAVALSFGPSTILVFGFGVFIAPLAAAFGWARPDIAYGSTIVALMVMLITPLQGWLADRFGARPVVLTCIPLFAAGLFAMSRQTGDLRVFYLLCGLLPVLGLGLWSIAYLRVVSTWYDRRLGLATGIANGGIGLGAALVPVIATWLMGVGDWRTAYLGLAALVLATWPLAWLFLREAPRPARAARVAGVAAPGELSFRQVVRTRAFLLMLVSFLTLGFVNVGLIVNQVPLLRDAGVSPERAAAAQATLGIAIIAGRFLCGVLLDRMSAPLLMALITLSGMAACLMYAVGVNDVSLVLGPILIGGVIGAEIDVLSYIVKRYFGLVSYGRVFGVVFAVFQLGVAIGAPVLPLGLHHLGSYVPGLLAYAASLLISAIGFLLLRPAAFGAAPATALPPVVGAAR